MTRCEHIESLLTEYLSDELGPLERAIVDDHLAECARCRAELAAAREIGDLVAGLPAAACPERVTDAILRAVDAERAPARPGRRAAWWRGAAAAATLAAAVLLAVVLPDRTPDPDPAVVAEAELDRARRDFLWTLAFTARVIDRSEKQSIANVLRQLRQRTPDSHAAAITGGQG